MTLYSNIENLHWSIQESLRAENNI